MTQLAVDEARAALLRANQVALARHFPSLAASVAATLDPLASAMLALEPGRQGLPTLKYTDREGSFYLHSRYDPKREAAQLLNEQLDQARLADGLLNVVVVFGFGLGYLVEALLADSPADLVIVVVEPDHASLQVAFGARDMRTWLASPRIKWVSTADPLAAVMQTCEQLDFRRLKQWQVVLAPAQMRRHRAFAHAFVDALGSELNQRMVSHVTSVRGTIRFLSNELSNFLHAARAPGLSSFAGQWADRPVVLVAAGPSLDKQLALLHEYQERCLIISVLQAYPALQKNGIRPHLVVAIDPVHGVKDFASGTEDFELMAVDLACNPQLVEMSAGRLIGGHGCVEMEKIFAPLYGARGVWAGGGSVATNAFRIAQMLKAAPMILVGQDLALTGGRSHGTSYQHAVTTVDEEREKRAASLREVEAYDGGRVMTTQLFDAYRAWFENTIRQFPALRVINATEGGARIAGAEQMPLAEALTRFALDERIDRDAIRCWAKPLAVITNRQLVRNLSELARQVRGLTRKAADALAVAEHWQKGNAVGESSVKRYQHIEAIHAEIINYRGPARPLIEGLIKEDLFAVIRAIEQAGDDAADRVQALRYHFESMRAAGESAAGLLDQFVIQVELIATQGASDPADLDDTP